MALLDEPASDIAVISYNCKSGTLSWERAIRQPCGWNARSGISLELNGNASDIRPWLDFGFWDVKHPLGERAVGAAPPYDFLPAEGENLHQIAVGPVHAGIIEPGHFRFTANGETLFDSNSVLARSTRALRPAQWSPTRQGANLRPDLRRQHGRLCVGIRTSGGSRDGNQGSLRATWLRA